MGTESETKRASTRPTVEVEAGPWSRKALWAVLAVAFVVRAAWLLNVNTMPVTDYWWYYQRAVGIASGQGYSVDGAPTAYWPVGYSAFLSLFFFVIKPTITFAKLLNFVLVMGSVALSFRIAHRLFRSNAVAVLSSLLLSLYMNWVAYSGILASEPLYAFLTLSGTWVLISSDGQRGPWTWGGFFFGLATLVRPQAALLPAIVLWCAAKHDGDAMFSVKLPRALWAAYTMLALVLAPWAVRNAVVFKAPVAVSTNMGDNLLIGNNAMATGGYMDPTDCGVDVKGLGEIERNRKATKAALDEMTGHPWRAVKLWPTKVWNTFGRATDGPYWAFQKTAGQLTVPGTGDDKALYLWSQSYATYFHGTLMIAFLAAVPVLFALRKKVFDSLRVPLLPLAMVLYVALVSAVFFGNPRYAFPVVPFVAMYAAALLVVVWQTLAAQKHGGPGSPQGQQEP